MIFGDPVALFATLTRDGPLKLPVPEAADVVLCFPEGLRAQVHLDYWCRPPMHRMDVVCSEGSIHWDYMTGSLQVWHTNRERCQIDAFPSVDARNELFLSEAQHFLSVLRESEESGCSIEDGIAVVRICEAIDRSAAAGKLTPMDSILPSNSNSNSNSNSTYAGHGTGGAV
jgi:predicted dehydrogenase